MKTLKITSKIIAIILAALTALTFAACDAANGDMEFSGEDGGILNSNPNENPNYNYGVTPEGSISAEGTDENLTGAVGDDELAIMPDEDDGTSASKPQSPTFAENPFVSTADNNTSTFSADVDTASYSYFRKLVNMGYGIEELKYSGAAFRAEEFINYFDYNVSEPAEGQLFGVEHTLYPCPWNQENLLLRVSLQAEKADVSAGNNLVFLIDVSGSMSSQDKLPLLKRAFSYLVSNLTENDVVSVVTYSGKEAVVLDGAEGQKSEAIMNAINGLVASGSTNGEAGLTRAYQLAEEHYIEGGNNRIIMASDGDLNVGISSASELTNYIENKRDAGIYLSVLGFGTGNYRDANMEALADNGNGVYYYIDGESEAEKVFGTDILGTLYTVAEDVKLQIEFNSNAVESYRLIGYENRVMNNEDFENDAKDAGEVGSSHQVTVCYEIKPKAQAVIEDVYATLRVRYKNIGEPISMLNEYVIGRNDVAETDEDYEFISCVIETVMILHNSKYIEGIDIADIHGRLEKMDLSDYPEREEFRTLIGRISRDD